MSAAPSIERIPAWPPGARRVAALNGIGGSDSNRSATRYHPPLVRQRAPRQPVAGCHRRQRGELSVLYGLRGHWSEHVALAWTVVAIQMAGHPSAGQVTRVLLTAAALVAVFGPATARLYARRR
jgi:hypothetical protein